MENGFKAIQEINASAEIRSSLTTFGEDVLQTKFPNCLDALKDITRRIIWFTRDHKETKGLNKVIGDIGDYHVGGDSSIYGALVRMGQSFMVGHPLIHIDGKSGEYYDPGAAAAPRYLKAMLSDFARDIYINGVHPKTLPMIPTKDFRELEPRYLIPRLPMALVLGNLTVGFGFKSHIPMVDFEDVCDVVMKFSEHYQKGGVGLPDPHQIAKYLVPSFPIPNLIKNKTELIKAYQKGDFSVPVSTEGWLELSGSAITLRAVPYGVDFGTVTKYIREQMQDRKHWLWDHLVAVNQFSSDVAELSLEFKRGQNPFEVLDKLRSVLRFNTAWKPIHNYTRNDRAVSLNPMALVYLWYQERMISIAGGLKYRQTDLVYEKMKLEAMLIICEHTDEVIDLIKKAEDEADAIRKLFNRFTQLTLKQARIVANQKITALAKSSRKSIESDLEQVNSELETVTANFGRIHETIYNDAQFLKKKYKSTRQSRCSEEFIGYVQFGNWGVIQFFGNDDLYEILNSKGWPVAVKKSVHFYSNKTPYRFLIKGGRLVPMTETSKEISCEGIVSFAQERQDLTLIVDVSDGNTCIVDREVQSVKGNMIVCPVTKKFYALRKNGHVTEEHVENFSLRKGISKGTKTNLIYGLPHKTEDVIVIHMNSTDLNNLRMDRILKDGTLGSLRTVPTGRTHILAIIPAKTKEIFLNIPEECRKNIAAEYLILKNPINLFKKTDHVLMPMGKTSALNKRFKRNSVVRSLVTLDLGESE